MKKLLAFFGAACAAFVSVYGETLDTSSFNRACPFTFASYQGASTLENFPVAVRLSESISGFSYADCAADGADLRFADADGNLIPHEIETWNTSGESIVWVRVPTLTGTATRIRLLYGQKADTTLPTVNARDVWSQYVTVVHGGSGFADSSPKSVAVANGGGVTASMSSGVIGGGFNKAARNTIGVNVANPMKNSYLTDSNALTLSAWYRFTSTGTDVIAGSKTAWGGTGFLLLCEGGSYMSCAVQSTHQGASGKGKLVQNSWNHVGFTYLTSGTTATLKTYFDGALIYENASAKSLSDEGRANWTFGGYAETANSGNHIGDMDELRIYDGIATADWMQAENDSIAVADFAAAGTVIDISSGRIPNSASVSVTTHSADGIVVNGCLEQLCDGATSVTVTLKWGTTTALEGEAVSVGTFSQIGDTFAVTLPATQVGATYYYALELTPDAGTADTTATTPVLFAGTGATWRPQTVNDTWNSKAWQIADTLYQFTDYWSATFDGTEANYSGKIQIPTNVVADIVTITGPTNYTMSGAGTITATKVVKSGAGTLTGSITQLAEPFNIEITEGTYAHSGNFQAPKTTVGTSRLVIGGGDEPAGITLASSDSIFGYYVGPLEMTVRKNGSIYNSNKSGWTRFGSGVGANCKLVVEQGAEINSSYMMIGSWGGYCEARVAGTITVRDNYFGLGEASKSKLTLLPGGRIRARGSQAWANSSTWSGYTGVPTLHVNDGTFEMYPIADWGTGTPILNTLTPVTYENAITFDIPLNGVTCCKAAITNVTETGTARFVKKGTGKLMYMADAKGITGVIDVQEGILTFSQAFAADADVTFQVAAGAMIGCDVAGGVTNLLKHLAKDCAGTLAICDNNVNDIIDLTEYPNLQIAMLTTTFNGQIIRADNHLTLDLEGRSVKFYGKLADVEGHPATLTVTDSVGGGILYMCSTNTTMTGGVTVKDKAILALYGPNGNAYAVGPSGPVKLESGTSLQLDAKDIPADFVKNRVTDDSDPAYIFVQTYAAACNVDVSRFPNCRVGMNGNTNTSMTGTITPYGDTYLLGGGNCTYTSNLSGFRPGTLTDDGDTPRSVVVDRVGMVNLSNSANTYSGGTVITNGARVYVAGSDGFGKVPAEFDADNIYVNGAVLRPGNGSATLAATRGLWVGDDGMTFHPWGSYTFTVPGGLGGTGDINVTDGGHFAFTGPYNTWNGHLTVNYGSTFTIGNGTTFSWASTGGIDMKNSGGSVVLNNNSDATFPDTVSGVGVIRKTGTGTLTMTAEQKSTGRTSVESGTLRLTGAAKLATNATIWNVSDIFVDRAGTASDVFGSTTILGGGTIRFRDSVDPTIDRALPGLEEVSVATNHSATFTAIAPDTKITLGGEATATFAASSVTDFGDFTINGSANRISAGVLQLTPATGNKAGSAYWNQAVDLTQPWEARFTYLTINPPSSPADGFAFVLQRAGKTALGAAGGSIGIDGVTPSFGVGFKIHLDDAIGWVLNGVRTDYTTSINGLDLVKGVDVVVTYDGFNQFKTVITQGTKTYTLTRTENLATYLGGATAWFGFAGGTGGANCDQRITNFSFTQGAAKPALDMTVDDSLWQTNGVAIRTELNGIPAFRLTDTIVTSAGTSGSVVRVEMISTMRPFKITGKYIYTATTSGAPADGAALFFQTVGTKISGAAGGSVGVAGVSPLIGWKLNLYNASKVVELTNGAFGTTITSLNGVDFRNQTEVTFTLAYTPGTLSLKLDQGSKSVTLTRAINLATYFNLDRMYFGMSGGTGGKNARQFVYDLAMEYTDANLGAVDGGYGALDCAGENAVKVATVDGMAEFGTLTLGEGAVVNVSPADAKVTSYALGAHQVLFDGAASTRTIALATGGTFKLGTIVHDGSKTGNVLKIKGGTLAALDGKITVRMSRVRGLVKVLDLTEATTSLTLDDFVLDTDETKGMKLILRNGVLYAYRDVSTIIFVR